MLERRRRAQAAMVTTNHALSAPDQPTEGHEPERFVHHIDGPDPPFAAHHRNPELFEQKSLVQFKCHALALWRSSGRIPTVRQRLYLGDGEVLRYEADGADPQGTER